MKMFFSTLCAILVAAAIIWFVAYAHQLREASARQDAEFRRITLDAEFSQAKTEWYEQMTKNRQFDPNAKKLSARLAEIKEAIDTGKPIPPSHWQSDQQAKASATNENAVEAIPVNQNAVEATPARPVTFTLTQPVIVQAQYGNTTLPIGTEIELVSQDPAYAHIRYAGREFVIPNSAVSK